MYLPTKTQSEKTVSVIFAFLFFLFAFVANSQTTLYNVGTIQKIEIYFSQPNYDMQMDTAKAGFDSYTLADSVKVNGNLYDSVGVKYKGNSSYNSTYTKNPLHVALSEFKSHSYQGIKDIKLSNFYYDPSMIREVLAYQILGNYMDCPRSNFAQVYINGAYTGLYSNDESINKAFCLQHFYSSSNTLIKGNPIVTPSVNTKCNLKYISSDSSNYFNYYEVKSNYGWNDLVSLADTVTNYPSYISNKLDMDRFIWMLAFDNVIINLDSYMGAFCQNYYLYKDNTQHFNPIVWDMNMSFGGFNNIGSGNVSLGSLTVANMQQLPLNIHNTDLYWPVINAVMSNTMYKRMYVAHMRTIINEFFANGNYTTLATQLQSIADTAVQSDVNKFYSYTQFQNGMTTNVTGGSGIIPGISNLMNARVTYLQATADFTASTPTITAIASSNVTPPLNSTFTITAQVTNTNTNAVYLGYRFNNTLKFTRTLMYDDGLHNDGAAGDNVYGAELIMLTNYMQYYIYAENNSAGMFSPERAEHEFYSLQSAVQAAAGQIVINEFMANNTSIILNEYGVYSDWIELYNKTSDVLSLSGLYITDDFTNPSKYPFPASTVIQPNGYLIVWADNNATSASYVHCGFNLSTSGEQIMLSSGTGGNTVIDSVSYFTVQGADASVGRCPNGTGAFGVLLTPTFNASNCTTGMNEESNSAMVSIYPNPIKAKLSVMSHSNNFFLENIHIYNMLGESINCEQQIVNNTFEIDFSACAKGIYFIEAKINSQIVRKKVIVQ